MRRFAALLGGLLLSVSAIAAIVYTPGPWKLYRSGDPRPGNHATYDACIRALELEQVGVGRTVTFGCRQNITARGVADPPSPPPPPIDCVPGAPIRSEGPWTPEQCTTGTQMRSITLTPTIAMPASNGGRSCQTAVTTETESRTCIVPPPPPPPPTGRVIVADDFNYVVDRLGSKAAFTAPGRWQGVKDQTTRAGANGFLYTATSMPNCGQAPDRSRFLVMEGLATTLGHQTDYYTQTPTGQNGTIPAAFKIAGELCVESGDFEGQHSKWAYPLFGTRESWPMASTEQASLIVQTSFYFDAAGRQVFAPRDGCFVFTNLTQAVVQVQVQSGNGWKLTPNRSSNPWICPGEWVEIDLVIDVSQVQGRFTTRYRRAGGDWELVTDWQGGVTPGFTWATTALDRQGAKGIRFPTTQGPGTGPPGPDVTQLWNRLEISALN